MVFLHGGPGLQNEGQFDQFISHFTSVGFRVYVPEIIGSAYYQTYSLDANEYKKNYCTDIQAVVNHMESDAPGKKYAVSHSLGCHQLFHFMLQPQSKYNFEAVSAIAGPWDIGANRLNILAPDWRDNFDARSLRIMATAMNSHVGELIIRENHELPMTRTYNPVVTEDLNKSFSVIYKIEKNVKLPPVFFLHAKDDKQVCFSLSLNMLDALKKNGNAVSGYFSSTGDHGFIKNPMDPAEEDVHTALRNNSVEKMLSFFDSPNENIYFDDQVTALENISIDLDAKQEHQKFLQGYLNQ